MLLPWGAEMLQRHNPVLLNSWAALGGINPQGKSLRTPYSRGLVALCSGWHLQDQAERQPQGREVSHTPWKNRERGEERQPRASAWGGRTAGIQLTQLPCPANERCPEPSQLADLLFSQSLWRAVQWPEHLSSARSPCVFPYNLSSVWRVTRRLEKLSLEGFWAQLVLPKNPWKGKHIMILQRCLCPSLIPTRCLLSRI